MLTGLHVRMPVVNRSDGLVGWWGEISISEAPACKSSIIPDKLPNTEVSSVLADSTAAFPNTCRVAQRASVLDCSGPVLTPGGIWSRHSSFEVWTLLKWASTYLCVLWLAIYPYMCTYGSRDQTLIVRCITFHLRPSSILRMQYHTRKLYCYCYNNVSFYYETKRW